VTGTVQLPERRFSAVLSVSTTNVQHQGDGLRTPPAPPPTATGDPPLEKCPRSARASSALACRPSGRCSSLQLLCWRPAATVVIAAVCRSVCAPATPPLSSSSSLAPPSASPGGAAVASCAISQAWTSSIPCARTLLFSSQDVEECQSLPIKLHILEGRTISVGVPAVSLGLGSSPMLTS
jgi:hypothetical protein